MLVRLLDHEVDQRARSGSDSMHGHDIPDRMSMRSRCEAIAASEERSRPRSVVDVRASCNDAVLVV